MDLDSLLRSPLGGLFLRPWYDRLAVTALANWYFPLSRAWAAAMDSGGDVDRFFAAVQTEPVPSALIGRALGVIDQRARTFAEADERWREAFFGRSRMEPAQAADFEIERLQSAQALMASRAEFIPLNIVNDLAPVRWAIADQAAVREHHGHRLADLTARFPAPPLDLELSRPAADGRGGELAWLRQSGTDDPVWARINRPKSPAGRPTLVYTHGICMETEYWEALSVPVDALAEAGICLVRPEGPFHGRRRLPGYYGGEPVIGQGVQGLLTYFQRHVAELGALIAWARETHGGPVAVGGISLGALTTQLAASAAANWPPEMRPDAVFLVTTSASITAAAVHGSLARALGVPDALLAEGWAEDDFGPWLPLLEPQEALGVAPDRVVVTLGNADEVTPHAQGEALLRKWRVPEANVFRRDQGHFTTSLGLARDDAPFRRLIELLRAV